MIRSENIPNAYKEVYTILKYVSKDDVNLIPKNFIKMLKSKMNVNYKFEYNENLDLEPEVEVEFNLKGLIRMDSTSQMAYLNIGISSSIISPNEARAELGYSPVDGGDSPMIQQQNYSLAALAARDATNPLAVITEPVAANDSEVIDE